MSLLRPNPLVWLGVSVLVALSGPPVQAQLDSIAGVPCSSPAPLRCPDANCSNELIMHPGTARVPPTRRAFFLDYPCDLKPNEAVTFVLCLHGGGMIANWQRHYFPIIDLKEKYRLVIATPNAVNVIRLDKGHTEGLEPNVTEEIVKLMVSARTQAR